MLPFAWLGAMGCCWLGRRLYGPNSATGALAMWCMSPSILGHGSLLTSDVPAGSIAIITLCIFDKFLSQTNFWASLQLGLALGLAALCKFSLLFLLPTMSLNPKIYEVSEPELLRFRFPNNALCKQVGKTMERKRNWLSNLLARSPHYLTEPLLL